MLKMVVLLILINSFKKNQNVKVTLSKHSKEAEITPYQFLQREILGKFNIPEILDKLCFTKPTKYAEAFMTHC